ncbi:unnamed protein product [Echinostoma caproni]|uniref:UAE_UbL domain-containing protein n=1 Tax=Echinostoma caproni TaxID=27848 RepID=A0A183APX1_9TREM|nr:unnamed protein product [Echinostoma caproni]
MSQLVRTVYLHRNPTGRRGNRRLVVPCEPPPPNPSCLVCSPAVTKSQLRLYCDPSLLTLRIVRDSILIRHLGMLAPDVEFTERGLILISSEEGETDEASDKTNESAATLKRTLEDVNSSTIDIDILNTPDSNCPHSAKRARLTVPEVVLDDDVEDDLILMD